MIGIGKAAAGRLVPGDRLVVEQMETGARLT